jgi:hypothetical protein
MRLFEFADVASQAACVLTREFGERSVRSKVFYVDVADEDLLTTEGTQTLDADQLRIKSLSDQKALVAKREKSERSRQKVDKAQAALQKANAARLALSR